MVLEAQLGFQQLKCTCDPDFKKNHKQGGKKVLSVTEERPVTLLAEI